MKSPALQTTRPASRDSGEKPAWVDPEIEEVMMVDYTRGGIIDFAGSEAGYYKTAS
jgi:hypothetical protein